MKWKTLPEANEALRNSAREPSKCKNCGDWVDNTNIFGWCLPCGFPPPPDED